MSDVDGIYVGHPDGRAFDRITTKRGEIDWSPDGQRLVLEESGEVFVVNRRGRGLRELTHWTWDDAPRWSPNGKQIAFVRGSRVYVTSGAAKQRAHVYVMSSAGGAQRHIARGSDPQWSLDGRRLAFVYGARIVVVDVEGNDRHEMRGAAPTWSPDSERIALVRNSYDEDGEIESSSLLTARVDGSDLQQLANGWVFSNNPQWSPDGRTIAVSAEDPSTGEWWLSPVDVQTSTVRKLVKSGYAFAWSPDGGEILFVRDASSRDVVVVIKTQTGATRVIDRWAGEYDSFAWSPNGRQIGFIRCTSFDVEPKECDVYAVNADGSRLRRLTSSQGIERSLNW